MNKKKIGVLAAFIAFTASSHAAFDQFGVSTYTYDGGADYFIESELPASQFNNSSSVGFSQMYLGSSTLNGEGVISASTVSLNASPVPLPSAAWFFGSAVIALTVIQRRG